jgi:hypothetical protein
VDRLTAALIDAWRRTPFSRRPRFVAVDYVADRNLVPEVLPRRRLIVVGSPPKWVVLSCPCGVAHVVQLNLANPVIARWSIEGHVNPSVTPSVDVRGARRCHFWLRAGRVHWVQRRQAGWLDAGQR